MSAPPIQANPFPLTVSPFSSRTARAKAGATNCAGASPMQVRASQASPRPVLEPQMNATLFVSSELLGSLSDRSRHRPAGWLDSQSRYFAFSDVASSGLAKKEINATIVGSKNRAGRFRHPQRRTCPLLGDAGE